MLFKNDEKELEIQEEEALEKIFEVSLITEVGLGFVQFLDYMLLYFFIKRNQTLFIFLFKEDYIF